MSAIGLVIVAGLGLVLRGTGVFRKVPAYVLDGIAAFVVLSYGAYFLSLANTQA